MCYEVFASIIKGYGGSVSSEFRGSNYVEELSGIGARRLSSHRSTVVNSNFTALEGMCLGFSLFMIEKHFNFPSFLSAISTGEGKGKVRGYMFVQYLNAVTKTGKAAYYVEDSMCGNSNEGTVMRLVENESEAAAMALAAYFDKTDFQESSKSGVSGSAQFIHDRPDQYFYLDISGNDGAHALALVNSKNRYGIFDPNYGMATLPKMDKGSTGIFCTCLEHYIQTLYCGVLSGSHHITSFKSKRQSIASIRLA